MEKLNKSLNCVINILLPTHYFSRKMILNSQLHSRVKNYTLEWNGLTYNSWKFCFPWGFLLSYSEVLRGLYFGEKCSSLRQQILYCQRRSYIEGLSKSHIFQAHLKVAPQHFSQHIVTFAFCSLPKTFLESELTFLRMEMKGFTFFQPLRVQM